MERETATATLPAAGPALGGGLTVTKIVVGLALLAIVVLSLLDLFCVFDLADLC
jgi:hypothetical protein